MRDVFLVDFFEAFYGLREEIYSIPVVIHDGSLFDTGELWYSWRPNEKCKDVLATVPALTLLITTDGPPTRLRHNLLVAQVSSD